MARAKKSVSTPVVKGGTTITNGAEMFLEHPYVVTLKIKGTADILFHRWDCEAVDEKANAPKGSKTKKTDNIESYVYRNEAGELCLPGEYIRMAMVKAAKYYQDPASSRKSAHDLVKASIIPLTPLAPFIGKGGKGIKDWDYIDRRRVVVNRGGVNRERPAMRQGWEVEMEMLVNSPDLIPPYRDQGTKLPDFKSIVDRAGMFEGVGDFRPTFGRFTVIAMNVLQPS